MNCSSACDVIELLEYWKEEPPAHVLLALRYLGPGKRTAQIDEDQTKQDLGQLAAFTGKQARELPAHLKEMVRGAEATKRKHKGLRA